ncbi:MAG: ATP-binding protein [Planctomycetota bacterium]
MATESSTPGLSQVRQADARIRELRLINLVVLFVLAAGVAASMLSSNSFPWLDAGQHTRLVYLAALLLLVALFACYVVCTHKQVNAVRDAALLSEIARHHLHQRAEDLKFLLQSAARIDPENGPEETLPALLGDLTGMMKAQHGTLFLPPLGPRSSRELKRYAEFDAGGGPREPATIDGETEVAREVVDSGDAYVWAPRNGAPQPMLACPLPLDGKSRGAIVLTGSTDPAFTEYDDHHVELLVLFANHAATTFGFGRRISRLRAEHESLRESYQRLMQERGTIVGSARASAAARTANLVQERIAEPAELAAAAIERMTARPLPPELEDGLRSVRAYLDEMLSAAKTPGHTAFGNGEQPLDELVEGRARAALMRCRQAIIEVNFRPQAQNLKLDGRAAAFRQCLDEVLDHAVKNLMQINPPRLLTVETCLAGGRARVVVHDNGPDIDLAKVPVLLAERSQHRSSSDTRVGLFAAADLLRRSGGDMSVKPHQSGGTSYVLEMTHAARSAETQQPGAAVAREASAAALPREASPAA